MKDKIFGILQRVGRSFMLPIAILPVAGLLLGIGGSFTNETMLETYGLLGVMGPGTVLNQILQVMNAAGNIIFTNLPIIFAMGVAIGMAKKEKEVAALAAVIAFFIMHASIGALINIKGGADTMLSGSVTDVCGITSLQMGVFGGIIVGLGVAVEGVEGFMPASHVELRRVEDFTGYVGKELEAEIIEVDLEKKRIVVSRRDLLRAEAEAKRKAYKEAKEARIAAAKEARAAAEEAAYNSVAEGEVYTGKVVKVAEFGLFVEIGEGLVGLVHNTELSWDRSVKAADVAKEGDEVTVLVKSIDRENKRVALSIKATLEDPWKVEASQFHIGDILDVEVVRLLAFGAIVKLSDKVEGLVHISEIAPERIEAPSDVLEVGQVVKAEIIKMDLDSKKIGLSISKVKRDAEKNEFRSYMGSKKSHLSQNLSEQLESLEK